MRRHMCFKLRVTRSDTFWACRHTYYHPFMIAFMYADFVSAATREFLDFANAHIVITYLPILT